jgi:excisionase family DNA binding protein
MDLISKKQDQPLLHPFFEEALKKIVYDAVRTVFEHVQLKPGKKEVPTLFGIDICCDVTELSKPTIYRNTSKNLMPHYRRDGKLLFKRDEIYAWMTENRIVTQDEYLKSLDSKLINKKKASHE